MIKEPTRAQQESVEDDQTHRWSIVATLVVPVHLEGVTWPALKIWKAWEAEQPEKTWEGWKVGPLPSHTRSERTEGDQRFHRIYTEEHKHVGKFKVESVELVMPDGRTHWGLVHLFIDDLDFKSLSARANDLKEYVRLHQAKVAGIAGITEIAEALHPAKPDAVVGSRASAVVLLNGDVVEWGEKGNLLNKALDIETSRTFADGTLLPEIRHAAVGLHGILIESNSSGTKARDLKDSVRGSYAEQVLVARAQREAVKGFVAKVSTLFTEDAGTKAEELVREFYRWRARSWWRDISTKATATAFLQSYQTALRLPETVDQLSTEMSDYAAIAQEDAAKEAAQSSYLFALTATIFTIFAVPATVGFTGAEVLGWHGLWGFLGALLITAVGSALITGLLWEGLQHLRSGHHFRYKRRASANKGQPRHNLDKDTK
jgi:hypothetical protein